MLLVASRFLVDGQRLVHVSPGAALGEVGGRVAVAAEDPLVG